MSPGIRHGVSAIDEAADYSWGTNDGRWMVMPIVVASDGVVSERPRQVSSGRVATHRVR